MTADRVLGGPRANSARTTVGPVGRQSAVQSAGPPAQPHGPDPASTRPGRRPTSRPSSDRPRPPRHHEAGSTARGRHRCRVRHSGQVLLEARTRRGRAHRSRAPESRASRRSVAPSTAQSRRSRAGRRPRAPPHRSGTTPDEPSCLARRTWLRTIAQPRTRRGCGSGRLGADLLDLLGVVLGDDVAAEAELEGQSVGFLRTGRRDRLCGVTIGRRDR